MEHIPTDDIRSKVALLAAFGVSHKLIAKELKIGSDNTLRKYYSEELAEGKTRANSMMAKSLFEKGMKGHVTAQIFWLKTQAGWIEGFQHNHSGAVNGLPAAGYDLSKLDMEDRKSLDLLLSKIESAPGAEST